MGYREPNKNDRKKYNCGWCEKMVQARVKVVYERQTECSRKTGGGVNIKMTKYNTATGGG